MLFRKLTGMLTKVLSRVHTVLDAVAEDPFAA